MSPEYVSDQILHLMTDGKYPGGTIYEVPVDSKPRVVPLYGVHPSSACVDAMVLQDQGMDAKQDVPKYFDGARGAIDKEREQGTWP